MNKFIFVVSCLIFLKTLKNVDADDVTSTTAPVLCPNSPVAPVYQTQPTEPLPYQPKTQSSPCVPSSTTYPNPTSCPPTCPPCSTTSLPCNSHACTVPCPNPPTCPCPISCSQCNCPSTCFNSQPCPTCRSCLNPAPCSSNTPSTCPPSTSSTPCPTTSTSAPSSTPCSTACSNPASTSTSKPPVIEEQTLPPPEITMCPPGTELVNGVCALLYCGTQNIYREGKCLRIECPEGTYWSGGKCETTSEQVIQEVTFNTNLVTHIKSSGPPIVVNNVNNVHVNITSTIDVPTSATSSCEECEIKPEQTTENLACCTVVTPRICKPMINGSRKKWDCYSKRYRRCGGICVAPTVYLRAPNPTGNDFVTVLPPENYLTECRRSKTCAESDDLYDCSGCIIGRPENCSSYCYKSICPSRRCQYYSQRNFCEQFPGEQGCLEEDGCFDDWCDSNLHTLD